MISMQNNKGLDNKGFTLVEIMVAGLLVSVMTLAISSVMISNQRNYNNFEDNQAALNELNRLGYYVNKYFSQAVNINYEQNNPSFDIYNTLDDTDTDPDDGFVGKVVEYNSTDSAAYPMVSAANSGTNSNIELMALTLMENNRSALNGSDSEFAALGMYFQRPTSQTYGQVIIQKAINITDANREITPGARDQRQTPLFFERMVEAHVLNVYPEGVADEDDITAMDLKFVARSFMDADIDNWNWCPTSQMSTGSSTCPPITVNDHEKFITVTFKNNLIDTAPSGNIVTTKSSGGTRPLGPIYFFQMNLFPQE